MNFFKILDKFKKHYSSLILYCLLDRIPIIVLGDDSDKTNNFLMELSELVHFRREFVFYTDFISTDEYDDLITNENIDYNYQRANIRCPCGVAFKALNIFKNITNIVQKKALTIFYVSAFCITTYVSGPWRTRTSDPLIMSQML